MLVIHKKTRRFQVLPPAPKASDAEVLRCFGMESPIKLPIKSASRPRIAFDDWYQEHSQHVSAIKGFIIDRLANDGDAARSVSVSSDDVLAKFVYENSSSALRGYKFLK